MTSYLKTAVVAAVLGVTCMAVVLGAWAAIGKAAGVLFLVIVLIAAAKDRIARRSCR